MPDSGSTIRRLIVNADDFGASHSINQAVLQAHWNGILTTASLMVTGEAASEAVSLAHENGRLGVGLHLALLFGRPALPPSEIPGLTNARGEFSIKPVWSGIRFFFIPSLREPIRREVRAQFARFRETGLVMDHVNGHLHMHLHPVVFRILMQEAPALDIQRIRLTCDPFWLNARIAKGAWGYRISHAAIYRILSARARRELAVRGIAHTDHVFGLLQNGRVDRNYVLRLLDRLPEGDSELYSHPSLDQFKNEFEALVDPEVRAKLEHSRVSLIRYQDL